MKMGMKSLSRMMVVFAAAFALAAAMTAAAFAEPVELTADNCTLVKKEFTYNGKTPALELQYVAGEGAGPVVLTKDVDYTLAFEGDTTLPAAGEYLAKATGIGDYAGEVSWLVKINPIAMTDANTTLTTTAYTYNGTVRAPSARRIASDGSIVAIAASNYTIDWYSDSACTTSAEPKNAGTYYAQIAFSNNYSGSGLVKVTISPIKMTSTNTSLSTTSYTYSRTTKAPTAKRLVNGTKTAIAAANYSITWYSDEKCTKAATPKNAGYYWAKVAFKGNYSGSGIVKVTIARKAITASALVLEPATYTYDGKAHGPAVKYKWSDATVSLPRETGCTVVYYTNKDCTTKTSTTTNGASAAGKAPKKGGTYYMKITGKGNYKGTAVKSFSIYYKATYYLNKGTNSKANKAKFIKTFKLYEPTRKSYTFAGWYTTKDFKSGTKVTSCKTGTNRTLYAKWVYGYKPASYVVGKDIPAGTYYFKTMDSSKAAYVLVYKDEAAKKSGKSSGFGAFDSMYYATLSNGQVVTTVNCCFQLSSKYSHKLRTSLTENDCGLYKVGTDIAAGTYRFSKIDKTGWSVQVFTSAKYCGSSPDKSKAKYFQTKSGSVTLTAGTYAKIEHATLTQ